ncbi:MAG: HAD family hydrolase [Verrucomicrobia bacterium]|nr:HAD family hydrolase [Verrucomicrobiota bacterium]
MSKDKREILDWLKADPSPARYVSAARRLDALADDDAPEIRVAILRNATIDPVVPYIKAQFHDAGLRPQIYLGNYDNVHQDVFDRGSPLFEFRPDVIILAMRLHTLQPRLVFNYAALSPEEGECHAAEALERVAGILRAIRERSPALILAHTFERPIYPAYGVLDPHWAHGQQNTTLRLNARLGEQVTALGGAFLVDLDGILSRVGYEQGLDDRYWHISRAPYKPPVLIRLADQYVRFAVALRGKNRKCLVLDCDNTLWGGVIGENGINGIRLGNTYPGSAYVEFQAAILDLYHRGVLLAPNSKNNEKDALEVFERHPSSLLKPEHFVAKRINWQDKALNPREIAADLNIGIDSLVFVDDNPVECAYVRECLPEVEVVQLPSDPTGYRRLLQSLNYFDSLTLTQEDRRRSSMYQTEQRRRQVQTESKTIEDYLGSLEMTITIGHADAFTIPRVAQLTQKTNQFNLTTRRYSEEDIRALAINPSTDLFHASLKDRFDDNGVIAAAIVRYEGDAARIDTLLMSCRVIGRGVEQVILAHLEKAARARGCCRLEGEYIPTPKNGLVRDLFRNNGFVSVPDDAQGLWLRNLSEPPLTPPPWFGEICIKKQD